MTQELSLEEENELTFSIAIEGTDDIHVKPQVRLMCEVADMSYGFKGRWGLDGEVNVIIPPMKGIIKEGSYTAKLEVIMADRYFPALELPLKFKTPMKVVAEVKSKIQSRPEKKGPTAVAKLSEVKRKKATKSQLDEMDKIIEKL